MLLLTSLLTSLAFQGTSIPLVSSKHRLDPAHVHCCCLGDKESWINLQPTQRFLVGSWTSTAAGQVGWSHNPEADLRYLLTACMAVFNLKGTIRKREILTRLVLMTGEPFLSGGRDFIQNAFNKALSFWSMTCCFLEPGMCFILHWMNMMNLRSFL